ncbi:pyridoxamine 5'-phosphate oxidase family protein [Gephyromycinifex aptenodytis]|uniref:pyridoxamine 5'-phosphate oxidase family protein n=1 Tax=Gephyromycinifex aptenodytis TaxID=2716227 RepID=UPI0014454BF6|nr:pyridoxamine 5'-phosphate oxidase family protein [Gephyromycinifex aptenodytis]
MAKEIVSFTPDECWDLLGSKEFGRLAYQLDGQVNIAPINYAVEDRRLVFRTGEGNKLLGVLQNPDVVFEVDDIGPEWAASIIVRGKASELAHEEALWADQMRLRPWIRSEKQHVVVISPTEVSGMKFRLHQPWKSMFPQP